MIDIDINFVLSKEMILTKEIKKEVSETEIQDKNLILYLSPSEYKEFIKNNPNSEKIIYLDIDSEKYLQLITEYKKTAIKYSNFWRSIYYKYINLKNNFLFVSGEKGNGKSSFSIIVDLMFNQDYQKFLDFFSFALNETIKKSMTIKHKFITIEEASSLLNREEKEIKNLIFEFFDRIGNTYNSYVLNAPNYRLFKYLKNDTDFLIDFYRRSNAIIWRKQKFSNPNQNRIYFTKIETIRTLPLNADLYNQYVQFKNARNINRLDYMNKIFSSYDI